MSIRGLELSTNSEFKPEKSHLLVWICTLASAQAANNQTGSCEETGRTPCWINREREGRECASMTGQEHTLLLHGLWRKVTCIDGREETSRWATFAVFLLKYSLVSHNTSFWPSSYLSDSWSTSNKQFIYLDFGKAQRPQNCQEQVNKNKIVNSSERQKRKDTYRLCF